MSRAAKAECELYDILIRQAKRYQDGLDDEAARDSVEEILYGLKQARRKASRRLQRFEGLKS